MNKMYYSKQTGGFYSREIHGDNIPPDAVEISLERWQQLLSAQSTGQTIQPGANGVPELLDAPPSQWHKLNAENEWVPDTTKKQELITAIRANIDADTDAKILNDFKIEGVGFKLSLENQMNYKAEYELRDVLTYPHKVKSIDDYHYFQDAAEYHLFYLSAVAFIRTTIEAGWDAKDALEGLTTEELIDLL